MTSGSAEGCSASLVIRLVIRQTQRKVGGLSIAPQRLQQRNGAVGSKERTSTGMTSLQETGPQMFPRAENVLSYKRECVFLDLMAHNVGMYNRKPLHLKLVKK